MTFPKMKKITTGASGQVRLQRQLVAGTATKRPYQQQQHQSFNKNGTACPNIDSHNNNSSFVLSTPPLNQIAQQQHQQMQQQHLQQLIQKLQTNNNNNNNNNMNMLPRIYYSSYPQKYNQQQLQSSQFNNQRRHNGTNTATNTSTTITATTNNINNNIQQSRSLITHEGDIPSLAPINNNTNQVLSKGDAVTSGAVPHNAYAAAKFNDPPSPKVLPKPPVHWTTTTKTTVPFNSQDMALSFQAAMAAASAAAATSSSNTCTGTNNNNNNNVGSCASDARLPFPAAPPPYCSSSADNITSHLRMMLKLTVQA
ncbi:putative uncharacterized protein DDB_G0279653 [Argonauta hians]